MSVYNGEAYLKQAIDSILNQTFDDFEFIIIDDGSTDNTANILKQYSDSRIVRHTFNVNRGLVHALNYGLNMAHGKFIARQDADDISMPKRFEMQIDFMHTNPHVVLVGSAYDVMDETGKYIRTDHFPTNDTAIRWLMLFHNAFAHTSVMFRADLLKTHNLCYNLNLRYSQDYDLWSTLLQYGHGYNFDVPLVKRRFHPEQVSKTSWDEQQGYANQISQQSIKRLGTELSLQQVSLFREWVLRFPTRMTKDDMIQCCLFLDILNRFARQSNMDKNVARRLRHHWIYRMLEAMHVKASFDAPEVDTLFNRWQEAWRSRLLPNMLKTNVLFVIRYGLSQRKK